MGVCARCEARRRADRGQIALHLRGDTFLVRGDAFFALFGCRALAWVGCRALALFRCRALARVGRDALLVIAGDGPGVAQPRTANTTNAKVADFHIPMTMPSGYCD